MGNFLKKIPPTMTTGLDLMHYSCVAGHIDLPGDKRECKMMQDTRVSCISSSARETIVSKLEQLAQSIKAHSEGVYTWLAFSSLDNDMGVRIFARFETKEAMELYSRRKDVAEFWTESKEYVKQMEWRCYVPNHKGWLHR